MDGCLPGVLESLGLDWKFLAYHDWRNRQPPNLTTPTNPIFSHQTRDRKRFKGSKQHYVLIEPAIRLASAILSSEASIRFIHAMVYEREKLPDQFNFKANPAISFDKRPRQPSNSSRAAYRGYGMRPQSTPISVHMAHSTVPTVKAVPCATTSRTKMELSLTWRTRMATGGRGPI